MRLFIAVPLDDEVKNAICETIVSLKTNAHSGSFTSRAALHCVLNLIGEVASPDAAIAAMDSITAAPFDINIGGYGITKRRTGNIHWSTVKAPYDELAALRESINEALAANGLREDTTEFKPTFTLGRDVETISTFNPATFSRTVQTVPQHVGEIILVKSEVVGGKQTYTTIYTKALG